MRNVIIGSLLLIFSLANAQVHRFYYELTYKPITDSNATDVER
ncbi:hypothetical protein [Epilithonimonas hominis]|uniref:GLPGLI family protein n=1 Tax=Epilithonimonas hominis TaxID=420404 RepID=A0A1H6LYW2_9FLAO|nr:hypothetical protein [Epilithonimonas hominis]SEH91658.1 hypothetical protein SAMN05421793_15117 [Epilithonimonas hominis]